MAYIKTYMFDHFYKQYLVLLTMAPRNNSTSFFSAPGSERKPLSTLI